MHIVVLERLDCNPVNAPAHIVQLCLNRNTKERLREKNSSNNLYELSVYDMAKKYIEHFKN